ncbi:MAG: hypothetical protein ACREUU_08515, partial [Gammaproteobacteria bacterium]
VGPNMQFLTTVYPNKAIYFSEMGYPSGAATNSSATKQKQFVGNVFASWDTLASKVKYISFYRVTDISREQAEQIAISFWPTPSTAFIEFLQTAGLRTYPGSGTDKPAWTALRNEARARGW